jgi:hypothetical protein
MLEVVALHGSMLDTGCSMLENRVPPNVRSMNIRNPESVNFLKVFVART